MRGHRHLLRDVFFLSLPVAGMLLVYVGSSVVSWWNAEIVNYAGYSTRNLRVGTLGEMVSRSTAPLLSPGKRDWISPERRRTATIPLVELNVRGPDLDFLDSALPASAKTWVPAELFRDGRFFEVEARHRGQRMENFFWHHRAWKIETDPHELVGGVRDLNVSPIVGRLDNHLSNLVGRRLGIPTPLSHLVHFFLNREDHGLYLQEEQVDESMMRRCGHMPGDVFYGDLFVPDEPKLGTDEVFCNPFFWDKKARNNNYDGEYRPHLTRLLDLISSQELSSWDELWDIAEREEWVRFFALIAYQGDQHVDKSHNIKLYFNPLAGKFELVPWNVRMNMPQGHGVESMANRLFEKLARDPRFLDDVHAVVHDELLGVDEDMAQEQLRDLDRMEEVAGHHALDRAAFEHELDAMRDKALVRGRTVRAHHRQAQLRFEQQGPRVELWCRAVASLQLESLEFEQAPPEGLRLVERRSQEPGFAGPDRVVRCRVQGRRLLVEEESARVPAGRDFSAPYHELSHASRSAFRAHRQYTRLAYLRSPYLLVDASGAPARDLPALTGVSARRTVGHGAVEVRPGPPAADELRDLRSVHPWRFPVPAPAPPSAPYAGEVRLEEDLVLTADQPFLVEPGTTFLLGPGVSIVVRSRVELDGVRIRRLDPGRPWGVFALQGQGAADSRLIDCDFEGGSKDRRQFVDYTGMLSVYEADRVLLKGGRFAANLLGDDTVRFARCRDLRIEGVRVEQANGDAIDCDISTGLIVDVQIDQPHNDGIDLMTASVDLERITVNQAGDKGVSLGENARPHVRGLRLIGCVIGMAIKDGSDPVVEDTRFEGCDVAVAGYDKNWRYPGGGRGRLLRCTMEGNRVDLRLDERSRIVLEDMPLPSRVEVPGPLSDFVELRSSDPEGPP